MRYDEFDEYRGRSSRGGSRSTRSSGSRDHGSREYDRSYRDYDRDYDRGYSSYDRDYDRDYGSSYDRDYDRSYSRDYRSSDRYSSHGYYDDFDQLDWERTAPNWEDRSGARKKSGGGSRGSSGRSSAHHSSGGSRGGSDRRASSDRRSYDSRSYDGRSRGSSGSRGDSRRGASSSGRRPSDSRRGPAPKRKRNIQFVPIILGLVMVILAGLIIKSFLGGSSSDYEIKLDSQTIVVGDTATATITGLSETEQYEITWGSSDPNVISIDGDGKNCTLTAKKEGSVTIAADINGETIQKTVMVVDVAPGVVGIKLSQETVEIKSGETYTAQATVEMESDNMSPAKVTWSSSDSSVAQVDKNGVITARNVGSAIIKATAGEKTAEIVVTVVENPDNNKHDESESTGNEPEEGSTQPDPGTTGNNGSTGTNGNTGTTGNKGNTGTGGTTGGTTGGETEGGDTGDLGSDITGQTPAEGNN